MGQQTEYVPPWALKKIGRPQKEPPFLEHFGGQEGSLFLSKRGVGKQGKSPPLRKRGGRKKVSAASHRGRKMNPQLVERVFVGAPLGGGFKPQPFLWDPKWGESWENKELRRGIKPSQKIGNLEGRIMGLRK